MRSSIASKSIWVGLALTFFSGMALADDEVRILRYEVLHETGVNESTVNYKIETVADSGDYFYVFSTDDTQEFYTAVDGTDIHTGTYTEDDTAQHTIEGVILSGLSETAYDSHTLAKPSSNTCTIIAGSGMDHIDAMTDALTFKIRWFNKDGGACTGVIEREVDSVWEEFADLGQISDNSTVFEIYEKEVAHADDHKYRCVLECSMDYVGTEVNYPHPMGE